VTGTSSLHFQATRLKWRKMVEHQRNFDTAGGSIRSIEFTKKPTNSKEIEGSLIDLPQRVLERKGLPIIEDYTRE
jgi:hypothetical protein